MIELTKEEGKQIICYLQDLDTDCCFKEDSKRIENLIIKLKKQIMGGNK